MIAAAASAPPRITRIDPTYLRSQAQFFRDLADEETDREKAALYREVAEDFDRDADAIEHGTSS